LQGFNRFIKKSGISFSGKGWQQRASQLFKSNKVNQKVLKDLDKARNVLNVVNTTKKEVEK